MSTQITHFGFNRTDSKNQQKPDGWYPVVQSDDGPQHQFLDVFGKVFKSYKLIDWLKHLVENQRRLCRIWVRYADGKQKCVYWYQADVLDMI